MLDPHLIRSPQTLQKNRDKWCSLPATAIEKVIGRLNLVPTLIKILKIARQHLF